MSDGTLTDYYDNTLMFSYLVRGVSYATSQDVSTLHDYIDDQDFAPGPIIVKYLAGNPANSIVVCEQWSGLRGRHQILKPTQIQETKVT
jgi:hypothetical protein